MHEHERDVSYRVGIVSISTSRFDKYGLKRGVENIPEDDGSGKLIAERLNAIDYILVPDDVQKIRWAVLNILERADVCITTGGTGVSPSDVTVEAVRPLLTRELEGFGEIFRMLSYEEVGVSAILSRAVAGLIKDKAVFCLPGSKKAVELGLNIINSLMKHLLSHARGLS